jgi:hypothetical protein
VVELAGRDPLAQRAEDGPHRLGGVVLTDSGLLNGELQPLPGLRRRMLGLALRGAGVAADQAHVEVRLHPDHTGDPGYGLLDRT